MLNKKPIDLGYVGEIVSINTDKILKIINRTIPVIASIGLDENGTIYNINADSVASFLAGTLKAEKIILITDIKGIMKVKENEDTCFSTLSKKEALNYIKQGIITNGMIPKVKACIESLKKGVKKAHIISGKISHSLLLELLTDKGIGTEIME